MACPQVFQWVDTGPIFFRICISQKRKVNKSSNKTDWRMMPCFGVHAGIRVSRRKGLLRYINLQLLQQKIPSNYLKMIKNLLHFLSYRFLSKGDWTYFFQLFLVSLSQCREVESIAQLWKQRKDKKRLGPYNPLHENTLKHLRANHRGLSQKAIVTPLFNPLPSQAGKRPSWQTTMTKGYRMYLFSESQV